MAVYPVYVTGVPEELWKESEDELRRIEELTDSNFKVIVRWNNTELFPLFRLSPQLLASTIAAKITASISMNRISAIFISPPLLPYPASYYLC